MPLPTTSTASGKGDDVPSANEKPSAATELTKNNDMETNNIQETFEKGVKKLYDKLEAELPEIQKYYDADDVTTFIAQCGRDYPLKKNNGIVFYGRSNNGWNPEKPLTMDDVVNYSGSPFFNLMHKISEHFYPEKWNTHVVWSNICKVVPASTGNPTEALWDAQYFHMVDILNKEMEILSPKVVIFVTGNVSEHWDAPLFEKNDLKEHQVEEVMWAENGRTTLYKKNDS